MVENDILEALRESYREVQSRKNKFGARGSVSTLRRYLLYLTDLLDIYMSIQRDRQWNREHRERY